MYKKCRVVYNTNSLLGDALQLMRGLIMLSNSITSFNDSTLFTLLGKSLFINLLTVTNMLYIEIASSSLFKYSSALRFLNEGIFYEHQLNIFSDTLPTLNFGWDRI